MKIRTARAEVGPALRESVRARRSHDAFGRGLAFPILMLSSRMLSPKCGAREVSVRLSLPGSVLEVRKLRRRHDELGQHGPGADRRALHGDDLLPQPALPSSAEL